MTMLKKWSDAERKELLDNVKIFIKQGKRIDWDEIQRKMQHRTRVQLKSYYTNHLKHLAGIESSTNRLPNEHIVDFLINYHRCQKDFERMKE